MTTIDSFVWRFLDGTTLINHPFIRFGFMPAWVIVIDEADYQTIFSELEARLNNFVQEQGELGLIIPMLYLEATA